MEEFKIVCFYRYDDKDYQAIPDKPCSSDDDLNLYTNTEKIELQVKRNL